MLIENDPLRSYAIAQVEEFGLWAGGLSPLINFFSQRVWVGSLIKKYLGLHNLPHLYHYQYKQLLKETGALDLASFMTTLPKSRAKHGSEKAINSDGEPQVIIVQDAFTSCFDLPTVTGIMQALKGLGFAPILLPLGVSGKAKYVQGFTGAFTKTAQRQSALLQQAATTGLPLVAIDPSVGLSYREEYQRLNADTPPVLLLQEWLADVLTDVVCPDLSQFIPTKTMSNDTLPSDVPPLTIIHLLTHCSEKALVPATNQLWHDVMQALGLNIVTPAVGCCGMAGTFGHEVANTDIADALYDMSWQQPVGTADIVLATGYSCRSQIHLHGSKAKHSLVLWRNYWQNNKPSM